MLEREIKKEERKNLGNDIKYVQDLNEWDKKYIYKPPNQPVSPPPDNSNTQENNQNQPVPTPQ